MTKKVKAVFTVEAAAVMLLTILTIFSLMSLSLWLRERVILSSALTESLYCRNRQEAEQCLNRAKEKIFASDSSLALDSFDEYTVQASGSRKHGRAAGLPGSFSFSETTERKICPGSAHFAPVSGSAEYHFHGERRLKWKFVIREN